MKLGDLYINTLKLLNDNVGSNDLSVENLTSYESDPQYSDHIHNMLGAINRGLQRVAALEMYETKYYKLTDTELDIANTPGVYDLNKIADYRKIVALYSSELKPINTYNMVSGRLLLANAGCYVSYYPTAPTITADYTREISPAIISVRVATALPHYIKYEFLIEENPQVAKASLDAFDTSIIIDKTHENNVAYDMQTVVHDDRGVDFRGW